MTIQSVNLDLGGPTRRAVIRLAVRLAGLFEEVHGSTRLMNRLTSDEMKHADKILLCEREINVILNGLGKIDSAVSASQNWIDEAQLIHDELTNEHRNQISVGSA